ASTPQPHVAIKRRARIPAMIQRQSERGFTGSGAADAEADADVAVFAVAELRAVATGTVVPPVASDGAVVALALAVTVTIVVTAGCVMTCVTVTVVGGAACFVSVFFKLIATIVMTTPTVTSPSATAIGFHREGGAGGRPVQLPDAWPESRGSGNAGGLEMCCCGGGGPEMGIGVAGTGVMSGAVCICTGRGVGGFDGGAPRVGRAEISPRSGIDLRPDAASTGENATSSSSGANGASACANVLTSR